MNDREITMEDVNFEALCDYVSRLASNNILWLGVIKNVLPISLDAPNIALVDSVALMLVKFMNDLTIFSIAEDGDTYVWRSDKVFPDVLFSAIVDNQYSKLLELGLTPECPGYMQRRYDLFINKY